MWFFVSSVNLFSLKTTGLELETLPWNLEESK
jgi:hypothetical protein